MSTIDVYVKLPTGRTSVQNLLPTDLVEKIYNIVAEEEGVAVERVRIKYTGKVLKKSDTIGYKGICRETVLKGEVTHLYTFTFVLCYFALFINSTFQFLSHSQKPFIY